MHRRIKDLIKITQQIYEINFLDNIARETCFLQRNRKISPQDFLALITLYGDDLVTTSLEQLCFRANAKLNLNISKESLNKKFNKNTEVFLLKIIDRLINNQFKKQDSINYCKEFSRVIINDSTGFCLPKHLANRFKGVGGASGEAGMKIQFEMDLKNNEMLDFCVQAATQPDVNYTNIMKERTLPNDLKLADLGYFKINYLQEINDKSAYFISKLRRGSNIYILNDCPKYRKNGEVIKNSLYKKIDVCELAQKVLADTIAEYTDIYIGAYGTKLKCRLIISKTTSKIKLQKEQKHARNIKLGKGAIKTDSDTWNSIHAYITNIDASILEKDNVHRIYSLRWQIELMFKVWKSIFKIHCVKSVKEERIMCHIYSRIIMILLASNITTYTATASEAEKSMYKSYQLIKEHFSNISIKDILSDKKLKKLLQNINVSIERYGKKAKLAKKMTSNDILMTMN